MRKLARREKGLLGLLAASVVGLAGWAFLHPEAAPAVLGRPKASRPQPPVPRIDLARIDHPRANVEAGRRDLFQFGPATGPSADDDAPAPPPIATPSGPPAGMPGGLASAASTPSLPPLSLKYIGSVENKTGVKVAVLLTDRREVLTGQAGQVVANRYRIARIGIESVDLEDVASGQSRRIPLKGN